MFQRAVLVIPCLALAGAMACGGGNKTEPASEAPKAAESTPAAVPAAETSAAESGEFGVAACDDYMKKYVACVESKVPDTMKATFRQQIDQSKSSWKAAAATPEGKQMLATICTQATESAKKSMQAYGCDW